MNTLYNIPKSFLLVLQFVELWYTRWWSKSKSSVRIVHKNKIVTTLWRNRHPPWRERRKRVQKQEGTGRCQEEESASTSRVHTAQSAGTQQEETEEGLCYLFVNTKLLINLKYNVLYCIILIPVLKLICLLNRRRFNYL